MSLKFSGSMRDRIFRARFHRFLVIAAICAATFGWLGVAQTAVAQWEYQYYSTGSNYASSYYGYSAAISGNTAIVGEYGQNAAHLVDIRSGNLLYKLNEVGGATTEIFGYSVGIDGNVAVIGDVFDEGDGSGSGAAYLYDVGSGSQLFKLTPSDGVFNDSFGNAVGVSGNVAIVGAPQHNSGAGLNSGAAYLYDVNTGAELFKLLPSDASAGKEFGWSVAISGNYALVGAPMMAAVF